MELRFLLAKQSEDQAGVTFSGANSHLMIALYKKDPKAFIMETCRISSPVGTFTTRLTASAAKELGLGLDLGKAQETHLAGVINVSNMDPRKFPSPTNLTLHGQTCRMHLRGMERLSVPENAITLAFAPGEI